MSETDFKKAAPSQDKHLARQLLMSMADTTWRMFVGPVVLLPVGIMADLAYRTKPWFTLVAAALGMSISVMLVRRQLRGSQ